MKKIILMSLLSTFCSGVMAFADYQCLGIDSEKTPLTIKEDHLTPLGDTAITLGPEGQQTQFFGFMQAEGGFLLQKKVVNLYPIQGDVLTIVSKPKNCGRGSCDFDSGPVVTAHLKLGETTNYFSCNETKF